MSALSHDDIAPNAATSIVDASAQARASAEGGAEASSAPARRRTLGLAGRLLLLTIGFV